MWYIIKIFLCSGILFGYYRLFLRNKRFHQYNRFYLLAALLLSVTIPLIRIPLLFEAQNAGSPVIYNTIDALTVGHWEQTPAHVGVPVNGPVNHFSWLNLIYALYAVGVLVLLYSFMRSLLYISKVATKYPHQIISSFRFYNTHEPGTPFSFLRSIFWNDQLELKSEKGQQVFRHEVFHVEQKHSEDIILAELFTTFCWFNPFFHLIKTELKAIHEFLADEYAVSGKDRFLYAELLIQRSITSPSNSITNYFFQNHIKRRIAMITHLNKTRYSYWSRVLALPLLVILTGVVSVKARQLATDVKESFASTISSNIPAEPLKRQDLAYRETTTANHQNLKKKATPTNTYEDVPGLDIEKVRTLLVNKSTIQDVTRLFGQPDKRTINESSEAWFYGLEGNRLMIDFNKDNDKLLSFFYHFVPDNASKAITYEAVKSIKKDITTIEEIRQRLGAPNQIKMNPATEDWFYQTADSWLQVEFVTGKNKVVNFFYNQENKKSNEDNTLNDKTPDPVKTLDTLPLPKEDTLSMKQFESIVNDVVNKRLNLGYLEFTITQRDNYYELKFNKSKTYYVRKEELDKYKVKDNPDIKDKSRIYLQLDNGMLLATKQ